MSYEDDDAILNAIAGRRPNSNSRLRANCPHCESNVGKADRKQCLELNLETGWWKCYRCEAYGKLEEIPHDTATLASNMRAQQLGPVQLPPEFVPLWTYEARLSWALRPAFRYLRKHRVGVTHDVLEGAKIGACIDGKFGARVVVPIYKRGKLAGYVGRAWWKKPPAHIIPYRYSFGFQRSTTLYNEEALYDCTEHPAIIVEGVFDTFPFWPAGESRPDGVAVLGKVSQDQFPYFLRANRPLLIAFDGDAHTQGEALAMHLRMCGKRAASLRLKPGQDPDECVGWIYQQAAKIFGSKEKRT